jgi:two-component sensor histidine kinase/Tfp pilus assembly protein PilF
MLFTRILFLLIISCSSLVAVKAQDPLIAEQISAFVDQAWDFSLAGNDSALIVSEYALELAQQNDYPLGEVFARESMGLFHEMVTGDMSAASDQYFKAIELCETHQLDYISSIYHSLGVMFNSTDNYDNARQYYELSLQKAQDKGDSVLMKMCFINLGSVYSSLNDFEKAESYMLQSLEIPLEKEMDFTTYANLGHLYVKQEKFDQAIQILEKATEENPDNPDADLNLYFLLHAKTMAQDSSNMKTALERAKNVVANGELGIRDKSLLLRFIADYLAFTGNYKEALSYRDQYIEVFEEIKEKQRDQVVLDLEAKYETEKKDAQLQLLRLEAEKNEQQVRFFAFLWVAALMVASLIGFFFYQNRKKNKLLTSQKKKLEENVEEINLLLREIHHRVKNNLQVITSMLNIQEHSISDKKAQEVIQESRNRIYSIGLIHECFYQNKNLGEINTREYIQNLTDQLLDSYQINTEKIKLETRVQDFQLDMDILVPLGMIINELVSNTFKHAFDEEEQGKLFIHLEKEADTVKLEVSDTGSGLKDPSVLEYSDSFGYKMINAFVKKLNGSLKLLNKEGATIQIEFAA